MSPKVAEPAVRDALIDAAARLLADEGPGALTTRRVAHEVGASTMVVYTHFGGKDELIRAVVWEGFERLARRLDAVELTSDPVADLGRLGSAYREHARTDPHLYRTMFGGHSIGAYSPTDDDRAHGLGTFLSLVDAVQRGIDAGRYTVTDATAAAVQIWTAQHGAVTLELANFLAAMTDVDQLYRNIYVGLAVALGDDPAAAARSYERALASN